MPIYIPIVIPVRKAALYVQVLVVLWDLFGLSLHLYMFMDVRKRYESSSRIRLPAANVTVFGTKN